MPKSLNAFLRAKSEDMLLNNPPLSQDGLCARVAKICLMVEDAPRSDTEFRDAAEDIAQGLFGEAYEAADATQKEIWNAMCEAALRMEAGNATLLN